MEIQSLQVMNASNLFRKELHWMRLYSSLCQTIHIESKCLSQTLYDKKCRKGIVKYQLSYLIAMIVHSYSCYKR